MFTANSALAVQDPYAAGTPTEIEIGDFSAAIIVANQEKGARIVGGVNDGVDF
jgi:hypothetical protein